MYEDLLLTATAAAQAGARALAPYFRQVDLKVAFKSKNDLVSEADRASEAAIMAVIRERFPGHQIVAEEGGVDGDEAEYQWLLDPLDGTANFVHGLPIYGVSVACRRRRQPIVGVVLDPQAGNLFSAAAGGGASWNGRPMRVSARPSLAGAFVATGFPFRAHAALDSYLEAFREIFLRVGAIRRCGAAAIDLAYTAAGVYDGFFEYRLAPWDVAAGSVLIREAGGRITDLDGEGGFLDTGNIVAGGPAVQQELLEVLQRIAREADLDRLVPLAATVTS